MMDDNQNNRLNPSDNPFNQGNQGNADVTKQYDEFGNRIVESAPPEPTVPQVLEEELGIGNTEEEHQKTALSADDLVSRTDSLNDWFDTLKRTISYKRSIVNMPEAKVSMDLPGVEPGRHGVSNQSSEPARPMPTSSIPEKPGTKSSKKIILAVIILVVCAGLLFTLYQTRFNSAKIGVIPTAQNTNDMIRKVRDLVELPISEQPSQIANVSDVEKLSSNSFFEKARNGDVVLLYQKNKTAILYRPRTGKVVAIGPLNVSSAGQVAGQSTTATPSAQ